MGVSLAACILLWLVSSVDPGTVQWVGDVVPLEVDPRTTPSTVSTVATATRERMDAAGCKVIDRWCRCERQRLSESMYPYMFYIYIYIYIYNVCIYIHVTS